MATKWFKFLCVLFLSFCFNVGFCFNRNNFVDRKTPTKKNGNDHCPLLKKECCGNYKKLERDFVTKHASEFSICIAQSRQESGHVSGFMTHNEGYEVPERKKNQIKGKECEIFECAMRELKLVDNKEQLVVAACETFLKQTFHNGELMDILTKFNEKCVKFANKMAIEQQNLSPNCNMAGIQYFLCLSYAVVGHCPERHTSQTPTCAKHQEEIKKCVEGNMKV